MILLVPAALVGGFFAGKRYQVQLQKKVTEVGPADGTFADMKERALEKGDIAKATLVLQVKKLQRGTSQTKYIDSDWEKNPPTERKASEKASEKDVELMDANGDDIEKQALTDQKNNQSHRQIEEEKSRRPSDQSSHSSRSGKGSGSDKEEEQKEKLASNSDETKDVPRTSIEKDRGIEMKTSINDLPVPEILSENAMGSASATIVGNKDVTNT